jgi:hypothetical protein
MDKNNYTIYNDWMQRHFEAWQSMINKNRVEKRERNTMPLSFRKDLASIYDLPATINCPKEERGE